MAGHYEAMLAFYGPDLGLRVARKHIGWYLDAAGLTAPRAALMTADSAAVVLHLIRSAFSDSQAVAA